jgi:hypothetical protein
MEDDDVLEPQVAIPDVVFGLTALRDLMIDTFTTARLPADISKLQQLRGLHLPFTMQLCRQVTRLRRLEYMTGSTKWAGDAEHVEALVKLGQNMVRFKFF